MPRPGLPGRDPASLTFDLPSLCLYCTFPLLQIAACACATAAVLALGGPRTRAVSVVYLLWACWLDESPSRGGYDMCWRLGITAFLRRSFFWRHAARYFPVSLRTTAALPAGAGPYIFVCHPHGIFGISPMTTFGTEATAFSRAFPGIPVHLLGHSAIFRIPFFREWCLAHGHGTVDRKTCLRLLRRGHSIALAPGGAKESLECEPGSMRLILEKRRGFAKLALQTGATLVPVLGFGENELYDTVQFPAWSWRRRLQESLQARLGFALPVFRGLRWLPLLPKRQPVCTVLGGPVRATGPGTPPAGGFPAEPSREAVAALHGRYCEALRMLFDSCKGEFGSAAVELQVV